MHFQLIMCLFWHSPILGWGTSVTGMDSWANYHGGWLEFWETMGWHTCFIPTWNICPQFQPETGWKLPLEILTVLQFQFARVQGKPLLWAWKSTQAEVAGVGSKKLLACQGIRDVREGVWVGLIAADIEPGSWGQILMHIFLLHNVRKALPCCSSNYLAPSEELCRQ